LPVVSSVDVDADVDVGADETEDVDINIDTADPDPDLENEDETESEIDVTDTLIICPISSLTALSQQSEPLTLPHQKPRPWIGHGIT
jgi:hypothetical protein